MKKQLFPIFILIAYCAILIKIMVFKDIPTIRIGYLMLNFSGTVSDHAPNFIPFETILPYLLGHKGLLIASVNLIGNIALLIPIGFLAPLVYRSMTWKKSLVLAVSSGLTIEIMQVALNVGIFDIDDIILNALGVMIGYWAFVFPAKWLHAKDYKSIVATAIIVVAASASMFYVIYPDDEEFVNSRRRINELQSDGISHKENEILPSGHDLCGGTGGTGQIMNVKNNTITVKLNDGDIQNFKLTDHTKIRTSAGSISKSDLKIGERITLVIDESETASAVLVCNASHPTTRPNK